MKGRFRAKATAWDLGESAGGKEQVAIEFEIVDGDSKGERRTYYGSFSDDAIEFTLDALRNCGWKGTDLTDLSGLDANEVSLVIEPEEYPKGSGKWHDKVRWVNRVGGLALKTTLTDDRKKVFAARMKERIAAFDAKNPQPKSDVPF